MSTLVNPLAQTIATSIGIAAAATVAVIVFGSPVAYALARPRWRLRSLVDVIVNLPLLLPPSVVGYYLLVLLAPSGWIGRWFAAAGAPPLLFTPAAAVVAAAVVASPLYIQALRNSLLAVDFQLIEAAKTDGAGAFAVLSRITFPLAKDGLITGALLAFARSLGEFGATLIVAGNIPGRTQTLSLAVYTALQAGQEKTAHALSLIAVGVGSAIIWLTLRLQQRSREITLSASRRPARRPSQP